MNDTRRRTVVLSAICLLATALTSAAPEPTGGMAEPTPAAASRPPRVQLGIDMLEADGFKPLQGLRVGLITNPTGLTGDLRSTIDVLFKAPGVRLVTLFAPEHGVRGEAHAGEEFDDSSDAITELPMKSLHGKTRKPTREMLEGIDILVFDIQDIGLRSYTYISTLAMAMEGAAENHVKLMVLDRPNPLTGERIEGRPLDLKHRSFVSYLPVAYMHGLTIGELARMINGEKWLKDGIQCDLQVIAMNGWKRSMWWDQTGLTWVPTSPHVPRAETALFYAATGIMGELGVISEGVGFPLPFELAGAPGISPPKLANELNRRHLAGVFFRPTYFKPFYHYAKETCGGVHIHFTDRDRVELTPIQFHVMDAVRQLYPDIKLFGGKRDTMFDNVCGTDQIRTLFQEGRPLDDILAVWRQGVDEFRAQRAKYLLYE